MLCICETKYFGGHVSYLELQLVLNVYYISFDSETTKTVTGKLKSWIFNN